ncbi:hypothetical protein [Escherichia coli]|uniref:hypothetical protein n=1 Tax=Escherichia coli TaxID=562 RepID=UPI001FCE3499|nr:hypothetical protein [Escherichia coli]
MSVNYIGETYFSMTKQVKPSQEAMDKRAFDEKINEAVESIINDLPQILSELIDVRAAELFAVMPECMKEEDKVTHQVLDEKAIRRLLAAKCGGALGRGMNFLQK